MIHAFKFKESYIAMDVESGAVHVLDKMAYDCITSENPYELPYRREEISEVLSEIEELKKAGALAAPAPEPFEIGDVETQPIKSMCLHVAHDCNLRCKYCFAGTGEYSGQRSLMSREVAKAALDFLMISSKNRHNLEVDFFGGEPLLNMDVVRFCVEYGRELEKKYNKKINFTMTTNGVALTDEISDWLNENMHNIVISLDGRREVHDSMRPTANGKSSYDITLQNAKKLIAKRGDGEYYIRGTYTCENLDFAEDVLELYRQGFKHISVEPVVLSEDSPYALKEEHLERIVAEYERLAEIITEDAKAGGDLHFFHFNIDLSHGPCLKRRVKGCGAGFEYVAISPTGEIYPCHQFVGDEDFRMGSVLSGEFNKKMQADFMKCSIFTKEKCRDCFAKYFCSGGCAANAQHYNGSIYKPHELTCAILKKRTECAIGIITELKGE
ncbi:MAG: thioether cross-link-forming SCIFF peptide maturase [Clostridia bacterium]|nr:thioether cross-link-forming SCIFF peptide maturase [Clostridia bacterium]